jgi:O-antigen ligase
MYFIYDHALIFLGDAIVLLILLFWLATKIANSQITHYSFRVRFLPIVLLSLLFLLSTLSILWSADWRTSLFISLHLWLVFLLILFLRGRPSLWKSVMLGFCGSLSIQILAGFTGFILQSTEFLAPLELTWPGPIDASVRGAIVVQLADGLRILRAYGTLPHPNVLGGFVAISLLGPIYFFLKKDNPNNLALLLLIPGVSLLALTFSRAAWMSLIAFSLILILKSKFLDRKRLTVLLTIIALNFILTLLPYRDLVAARTVNTGSGSEEFSIVHRAWLNGEAVHMIRDQPLTGLGIGSFMIELAGRAGEGYVIEPVHNIFLLTGAELGIPGMLLIIAFALTIVYSLFKAQGQNAILVGAALAGIGVIGLFDHYLWTLAPNRVLLGLVLGLWAGQSIRHDA